MHTMINHIISILSLVVATATVILTSPLIIEYWTAPELRVSACLADLDDILQTSVQNEIDGEPVSTLGTILEIRNISNEISEDIELYFMTLGDYALITKGSHGVATNWSHNPEVIEPDEPFVYHTLKIPYLTPEQYVRVTMRHMLKPSDHMGVSKYGEEWNNIGLKDGELVYRHPMRLSFIRDSVSSYGPVFYDIESRSEWRYCYNGTLPPEYDAIMRQVEILNSEFQQPTPSQ